MVPETIVLSIELQALPKDRRLVERDPKLKREFTRILILRTKGSTKIFAYVFWGRAPPGWRVLKLAVSLL